MGMIEEIEEMGANTGEAMKRFLNNTALYEKMLKKLPDSMNGKGVMEAIEAGNIDGAIEIAHTLKGVLGNLSITPLYEAYTKIVALLRQGDPEEAKKILEDSFPAEEKLIACIEKYR